MKLYFQPLACSMASRIALYEAGADAEFDQVDQGAKRTQNGGDFYAVNPMGQVPVLALESGEVVTENAAVLQRIADLFPQARLAPPAGTPERARLQQWLNFIATELHKGTFVPLLDRKSNEGARDYARAKTELRLGVATRALATGDWLVGDYSVADAYLFTVLNWGQVTDVALKDWPALDAFFQRMRDRPAVARALAEETELYRRALARAA